MDEYILLGLMRSNRLLSHLVLGTMRGNRECKSLYLLLCRRLLLPDLDLYRVSSKLEELYRLRRGFLGLVRGEFAGGDGRIMRRKGLQGMNWNISQVEFDANLPK